MVLPTETRGANLLIDLDAIAVNYRLLQREAAGAEVAAVVKADAYGLGMQKWRLCCPTLAAEHFLQQRRRSPRPSGPSSRRRYSCF